MYECMNVWMSECMNVWMYVCMNVWMYECMNVWMYECMNVWMYECMYVRVCMYVCMYVHLHLKKNLIIVFIYCLSSAPSASLQRGALGKSIPFRANSFFGDPAACKLGSLDLNTRHQKATPVHKWSNAFNGTSWAFLPTAAHTHPCTGDWSKNFVSMTLGRLNLQVETRASLCNIRFFWPYIHDICTVLCRRPLSGGFSQRQGATHRKWQCLVKVGSTKLELGAIFAFCGTCDYRPFVPKYWKRKQDFGNYVHKQASKPNKARKRGK